MSHNNINNPPDSNAKNNDFKGSYSDKDQGVPGLAATPNQPNHPQPRDAKDQTDKAQSDDKQSIGPDFKLMEQFISARLFAHATPIIQNVVNNYYDATTTITNSQMGSGNVIGTGNQSSANINKNLHYGGNQTEGASTKHQQNLTHLDSQEEVNKWILAQPPQRQITIFIVAVFHGNIPTFIYKTHEKLQKKLGFPQSNLSSSDKKTRGNHTFSLFNDDILDDSAFSFDNESVETETGKSNQVVVRFASEVVLQYVFEFFTYSPKVSRIHPILISFLEDIVKTRASDFVSTDSQSVNLIKIQAAVGIGILAKRDFSNYLNTIIRPWAMSDHLDRKLLTGWIFLGLLYNLKKDESIETKWENTVSNLLKQWIAADDNLELNWSAIYSCFQLGLANITQALKILKIAFSNKSALWAIEILGLIYMLYAISETHAKTVIQELADWVAENSLKDISCLCFLAVTQQNINAQVNARKPKNDTRPNNNIQIAQIFTQQSVNTQAGKRKAENGDKTKDKADNKITQWTIWDLLDDDVGNTPLLHSELEKDVESILKHSLLSRSAFISDLAGDVITSSLNDSSTTENKSSEMVLCRIISNLKNDSNCKRYVEYALRSVKTPNQILTSINNNNCVGGNLYVARRPFVA